MGSCIKNVLEPSSSKSLQVHRLTCKLKYRDVAHPKTLYHAVHYVGVCVVLFCCVFMICDSSFLFRDWVGRWVVGW